MRYFAVVVIFLLGSPRAGAGEGKLRAYRAARIIPVAGEPVAPGVLLVRDNLIEGVLPATASLPAEAEVVDLGDAVILPGLVNPLSAISESALGGAPAGGITSLSPGPPGDARQRKALADVKPESKVYRRLGKTGYAAFGWLASTEGLFAGQAVVLRPRRGKEKESKDLVLKESAYLLMSFDLGKRWRDAAEGALKKAAEAIVKEREPKKKEGEAAPDPKAADPKPSGPKPAEPKAGDAKPGDAKPGDGKPAEQKPPAPAPPAPKPPGPPDPLEQAFKGELPLFVRLRTPAAVDHFFRIIDALPVKPSFILVTAPEPPEIVEKLSARKDVIRGVVIEPRMGSLWETSIAVNAARLFAERGFKVALVPPGSSIEGHRQMLFHVAQLIRGGLRAREALEAVTTVPAGFLGLEGKVGALVKGASASFAAYSGEPLSGSARLIKVFVEGEEVFSDDPLTGTLAGEAVR